jgi:hypothetical protein
VASNELENATGTTAKNITNDLKTFIIFPL